MVNRIKDKLSLTFVNIEDALLHYKKALEKGLIKGRSIREVKSFMRLAGIRRIEEIEISNVEINGQISFIRKENNAKKVQRKSF